MITYTYSGQPVNAVFTVFQIFCPWQNAQKISKSGSLYSTDNFFHNIVVSTVNLPLSKHTKCKDLAVAYKNQTTGTPFLEKWWELVKISQSIIGNNQIAPTDRSSIIIRKNLPISIPCIFHLHRSQSDSSPGKFSLGNETNLLLNCFLTMH